MSVSSDAFHRLGRSRFQAYADFARNSGIFPATTEVDGIAMELYRWNAEASAVLMRYIPWIEVLVVLLQCLFDRFGSVFPQCGLMVFPGAVIVSR